MKVTGASCWIRGSRMKWRSTRGRTRTRALLRWAVGDSRRLVLSARRERLTCRCPLKLLAKPKAKVLRVPARRVVPARKGVVVRSKKLETGGTPLKIASDAVVWKKDPHFE